MSDQLQSTQETVVNQPQLLPGLAKWVRLLTPLYQRYVPKNIRQRPNVHQAKLSDVLVLALMCWQVTLKMTVQTRYYQFLVENVFSHGELPERSRFNRLCRQDGRMLWWIRYELVQHHVTKVKPTYTIIDSLPLPLCHGMHQPRAKALHGVADFGYNATKHEHFYGLKGHFEVTNDGLVVAYTITPASVHDIKVVRSLLHQYSCPHVLADVGYLSAQLKQDLRLKGIYFWTPVRSNMKQPMFDDTFLKRKRRYIETVFSNLNKLFDIENIRVNSLDGFQSRLEQCLLVHTVKHLGLN